MHLIVSEYQRALKSPGRKGYQYLQFQFAGGGNPRVRLQGWVSACEAASAPCSRVAAGTGKGFKAPQCCGSSHLATSGVRHRLEMPTLAPVPCSGSPRAPGTHWEEAEGRWPGADYGHYIPIPFPCPPPQPELGSEILLAALCR